MTVPALLFVDRWGRRTTLVAGATSMMIWWFITAGILVSYGHHAPPGGLNHVSEESWLISGAPSKAVIASSYLIVASYAPSWGPVSWTYPPELFPLRLRAKGVSVSTAACWIMNFALGYFTPPAFTNIAWKIYLGKSGLLINWRLDVILMFWIQSSVFSVSPWQCILSSCSQRPLVSHLRRLRKCLRLAFQLGRRMVATV